VGVGEWVRGGGSIRGKERGVDVTGGGGEMRGIGNTGI